MSGIVAMGLLSTSLSLNLWQLAPHRLRPAGKRTYTVPEEFAEWLGRSWKLFFLVAIFKARHLPRQYPRNPSPHSLSPCVIVDRASVFHPYRSSQQRLAVANRSADSGLRRGSDLYLDGSGKCCAAAGYTLVFSIEHT